jgi:hypothetical protein
MYLTRGQLQADLDHATILLTAARSELHAWPMRMEAARLAHGEELQRLESIYPFTNSIDEFYSLHIACLLDQFTHLYPASFPLLPVDYQFPLIRL